MKILTTTEMKAADTKTAELGASTFAALMENAGAAVARFILTEYPDALHIGLLCGTGNNGGDGFVAARHLAEAGRRVRVYILGDQSRIHGDARASLATLMHAGSSAPLAERIDLTTLADENALASASSSIRAMDLLVDAVLGTGFTPPLRGVALAASALLRGLANPIVAVDVPSGWSADEREIHAGGPVFPANAVVTFTAPKLVHVSGLLTRSWSGGIVVAAIGSPEKAVQSNTQLEWCGEAPVHLFTPRSPDANKGRFGHVLLVGGAWGRAGAAAMASLAALRAGAGLVTAAIASSILPIVAGITPELMTLPLKEADAQGQEGQPGEASESNLDQIDELLHKKTIVAVGPGLGQGPKVTRFLLGLAKAIQVPTVLDADALNIFASHPEELKALAARVPVVLTPHPGEMARLTGTDIKTVQADREGVARRFAQEYGLTLVLKGWRSLVCGPSGVIGVNTTGNPGMAKGGSGDILTGIMAAMLAQYPSQIEQAARAAVYIHGLAADLAMQDQHEKTLLATDTIAHLARAFLFSPQDENRYVWIQGLPRSASKPR